MAYAKLQSNFGLGENGGSIEDLPEIDRRLFPEVDDGSDNLYAL